MIKIYRAYFTVLSDRETTMFSLLEAKNHKNCEINEKLNSHQSELVYEKLEKALNHLEKKGFTIISAIDERKDVVVDATAGDRVFLIIVRKKE